MSKRANRIQKRLKKDITIPAGTIFETAPTATRRHGPDHVECTVGLTNDSCGFFTYCIDDPELDEFFEDVARTK